MELISHNKPLVDSIIWTEIKSILWSFAISPPPNSFDFCIPPLCLSHFAPKPFLQELRNRSSENNTF